jgi:hypothetical protein
MTQDQMDLLVEQVKMLAGEIAFSTSTLKRLVEHSVNDPDNSKTQVCFSSLAKFYGCLCLKCNFKMRCKAMMILYSTYQIDCKLALL